MAPPLDELELEDLLTPDDIELPPRWEQRKAASGRVYFADHVSKKTTWQDPRFMPDNWDQRLDAITGKVRDSLPQHSSVDLQRSDH